MKRVLVMLLSLIGILTWGMGQESPPGFGAQSQYRFGVGARALSLAGAFTAMAEGPSGIYWNPAALVWNQPVAGGMYTQPFSGLSGDLGLRVQYLGLGGQWEEWGLGGGWFNVHVSGIVNTETGGTFDYDSSVFQLAVAREVEFTQTGPRVAVGATLKLYREHMLEGLGQGLGWDVGILLLGRDWRVGYCSQDVGTTRYRWQGTEQEPLVVVPWVHRLGVARWFAEGQLALEADLVLQEGRSPDFRVGLEWRPWQELAFRAGVKMVKELGQQAYQPQFSLGSGLRWESFYLDVAYLRNPLASGPGGTLVADTYVFSVAIEF